MTDEHVKGTITQAEGQVEEAAASRTGNKEQEAHGRPSRSRATHRRSSATSRTPSVSPSPSPESPVRLARRYVAHH